jgi:hypothetical protein
MFATQANFFIYFTLRSVIFTPEAVPGFISICPFKVLFPGNRFNNPAQISCRRIPTRLLLKPGKTPVISDEAEKSAYKKLLDHSD